MTNEPLIMVIGANDSILMVIIMIAWTRCDVLWEDMRFIGQS